MVGQGKAGAGVERLVSIFLDSVSEELIADLWERHTTGIVEEASRLEAFFETLEEAAAVALAYPYLNPRIQVHAPRNYVRQFQEQWHAVAIGRRLWLAPPWEPGPAPERRVRLDYQPGMACGSGAHPCTQLCLEALDDVVRPGCAVLDVGCGSGILLLAARLLGARLVVGCDIEQADVRIAAEQVADVFTGSASALGDALFDVVIANISAPVVRTILPELRRVARPGAIVLLSGFEQSELDPAWATAPRRHKDGWVCVELREA